MRTIIYHPAFTSRAYLDLQRRNGIALQESAMGDEALLNFLELVTGIHHCQDEYDDLLGVYHDAMEKVMLQGENILTRSWDVNPLAVAEQCLYWRNQLRLSGWDPSVTTSARTADVEGKPLSNISERLDILAKVEDAFSNFDYKYEDTAFRIDRLIKVLHTQELEPVKISVAMESVDTLPWKWQQLFDQLEKTPNVTVEYTSLKPCAPKGSNLRKVQEIILGVNSESEKVYVSQSRANSTSSKEEDKDNPDKKALRLNADDPSLRIWRFPSNVDACRYFSHIPCEVFDLRVCSDTTVSSSVRRMLGLPSTGAQIKDALPQVAQLFRIGITLWKAPLNLHTLLAWLVAPYHPLPWKIKNRLANVVSSECGVNNEAYQQAIKDYIRSLVDEEGNPNKKQQKKELEMIRILIPTYIENENVDKKTLLKFIELMIDWSQKSIHNEYYDEMVRSQMAYLNQKYKALEKLVLKSKGDTIAYEQLESWMCTLDTGATYILEQCQAGSPYTVSPMDIAEECQRILWTDCYNYTPYSPADSFLCPREKQQLEALGCHFPDSNKVNLQAYRDSMLPVLIAKEEVVLCLVDNCSGEKPSTHPLVIMLETLTEDKDKKEGNQNGLEVITEYPHCREHESARISHVAMQPKQSYMELRNKEMIEMRQSESYSSLDLLFQYPVDYLSQYLLGFHQANVFSIPELDTIKGTVAHGVIEHLFHGTAQEIRSRIEQSFDSVLKDMIIQKGATLLLEENTLTKRQFEMDLRENVQALSDILEANNLCVFANEYPIDTTMSDVSLEDIPDSSPADRTQIESQLQQLPQKFKGFVDLLLEDSDGRKYIIDMKWTRSKRHRGYLENDSSIQLALYEFFTGIKTTSDVVATAYFIMPKHQLFTTSDSLHGPNVVHVAIKEDVSEQLQGKKHSLWDKICNTYAYRRNQLLNGILENADEDGLGNIQYFKDTEEYGLVPLSEYEGVHSSNLYSDITYLKLNNLN